jgi:hypothetical protein
MTPQTSNTSVTESGLSPLNKLKTQYDPDTIQKQAAKDLKTFADGAVDPQKPLFKALTLSEFENGVLMTTTIPEQYKTLAIDMSRKLQVEYNCQTISEKATCELAAISYVRQLESQRRINLVLEKGYVNANLNQYISVMSKELDRATRHYFSAIQTLRMMKQAPITVTIKAQTAIVGNNQMIQANREEIIKGL